MFKNNLGSGYDMAMGKEIGTDQPDSRANVEIPLDELIESTLPIGVEKSMSHRKADGSSDYDMASHTDGMAVPIDELIKKTKPE